MVGDKGEVRRRESGESGLGEYLFLHNGSVRSGFAPREIVGEVLDACARGDSTYQRTGDSEFVDMSLIEVRSGSVFILPENRARINEVARDLGFMEPYVVNYDLEDPVYELREDLSG